MKLTANRLFAILTIMVCLCADGAGQMAKIDPLPLGSPGFVKKIIELKAANPKSTAAELTEAANVILEKSGIGFGFHLDAATCERIRKAKQEQKDPNAPLKLGAKLKSVEAEGASLSIPEPVFTTAQCGDCYVEFPVLEITGTDFVTIVSGQNIKFVLPSNFSVNEAVLLDPLDRAKVKSKWWIPFRAAPIGVTFDESVLYLAFNEPELDQLSLAVFRAGVFQIATREEAESGGKGKLLANPSNPQVQTVRFDRWKNSYVVAYKPPCQR